MKDGSVRAGRLALTALAMLAFAGNSILCRLALQGQLLDAASFSVARVTSGAAALLLLARLSGSGIRYAELDWRAAAALAGYLVCFSYGYLSLSTATGALILFGAVQGTMLAAAWLGGERFSRRAWLGFTVAIMGFVFLLVPGVQRPSPGGALLLGASGLCWGIYSLSGRHVADPLSATAGNFLIAAPITLAVCAVPLLTQPPTLSPGGLLLGVSSGAIASACGYSVWFAALKHLGAANAATVQLTVPVIAGFGGVLFL